MYRCSLGVSNHFREKACRQWRVGDEADSSVAPSISWAATEEVSNQKMSTEIQTVRDIQTTELIQAMDANTGVAMELPSGMYANQENYPTRQQISVGHLVQQ